MSHSSPSSRPGGIVLAGGFSRRMGEPKALLRFGASTLLERVIGRITEACDSLVVSASPDLVLPPLAGGVRVIRDSIPDGGPLIGLADGISHMEDFSDWVFVCAVDSPLISAALITLLWGLREGVEAVVPRFDEGTYPLIALYATSLAPRAREMVENGERRARSLADSARTRFVSKEEIASDSRMRALDPSLSSFRVVNTRADFEEAQREVLRLDRRAPEED